MAKNDTPAATDQLITTKKAKSNVLPAIGNFNIQYNFTSASLAKLVMSSTTYWADGLYPVPGWTDDVLEAIVFVGAMIGMIVMGRAGDILGRPKGMRLTLIMAALGAVIPACAGGDPNLVYGLVCVGRLILGIGVGGIYPLAAVSAAEGSGSAEKKGKTVAGAFFWQTPGVLAPYLLALIMFKFIEPMPPQEWVPQMEFRLLFGLGVVPGLIVFIGSLSEQDSEEFKQAKENTEQKGYIETITGFPTDVKKTLLGTSGAWFFYDISYYGINIFTPTILDAICMTGSKNAAGDCTQTLYDTALQGVITNALGLPACFCAIMLIERWGSKTLNIVGFTAIAVFCLAFAIAYSTAAENTSLLFGLYCGLVFALNFGPNIGTYVLPAICFPAQCRGTCHGMSAMSGKFGAVVGTFAFTLLGKGSLSVIFVVNFVVAALGALFSQFFLKNDWEYLSPEERVSTAYFMGGSAIGRRSSANLQGVGLTASTT